MEEQDIVGVLKFSYHSPRSNLPIPDFAGDRNDKGSKKTEPHFLPEGMMAENYLKTCYPRNIKIMVEQELPYLFWVTRKQEKDKRITHEQVIIGYLEHEENDLTLDTLDTNKETGEPMLNGRQHYTLFGTGHLYRFEEALPTKELFGRSLNRVDFMHRFTVEQATAERILDHFKGLDNIVDECASEIARLDKEGVSCFPELCALTDICGRYEPGYGTLLQGQQPVLL